MANSTYPEIFAVEIHYGNEYEILYFVPTNPGQVRVFISRDERIEELTDLHDRRMSWNKIRNVYLTKLSDRQKQNLLTGQGLTNLLQET